MDTDAIIVRSYTGPEIAAMTPERANWIAVPWVAHGAITEVSGKIKTAGKTTFIAHLCGAVVKGGTFLGRPTKRTSVIYVTEQTPDTFRHSLRGSGLLDSTDFHVFFLDRFRAAKQSEWMEMIAYAVEDAGIHDAGLIVFDTLMQLAAVRDEHDASEAARVMQPLQEVAGAGHGVIVSRHDRKAGGEVGDSSRGSSAYAGAVDIMVQLKKLEGAQTNERVLNSASRYEETPAVLTIALEPEGYVVRQEGQPERVKPRGDRAANQLVMYIDRDHPKTLEDLMDESNMNESTVRRLLGRLYEEGRIDRIGSGKRGDPHRFLFTSLHPMEWSEVNRNEHDGSPITQTEFEG